MSKAELLDELPRLRPDERQEILDRLCDLQEAELGGCSSGMGERSSDQRPGTSCGSGRLGTGFDQRIGARSQAPVKVVSCAVTRATCCFIEGVVKGSVQQNVVFPPEAVRPGGRAGSFCLVCLKRSRPCIIRSA
jgi:hypothetical protein